MILVTLHDTPPDTFIAELVTVYRALGLTPRTATLRAGREVYDKIALAQEDGPRTILPGVGWFGIEPDPDQDDWTARFVERQL